MSKILLVNVPFYRLLGSHYNANSLGIAYIASVLNEAGHDAWLYNADFMNRDKYENLKGLFEGFHDYKKYFENPDDHEIWEEVIQKIVDFKPDWVGWTCYTANITAIDILSKKLKEKMPEVKQVVGGPHSTLDRNLLNTLTAVDYACAREGEHVMRDLVDGKDPKKIIGCISRTALGIYHNGDAEVLDTDALPFPERDKFWGLTEEEKLTVDVSYVVTVRGCPYRCNYCASPYSWKRSKTQYRSPESVIKELKHIKENYWNRKREYDFAASANAAPKKDLIIKDNSMVYFVDDIFTVKNKRVKEILRRMIDEDLAMPFKCEARTDHLDEEICELLKKANCQRVKLGFETGSARILKEIQKDETKEEMLAGAGMLRDAGVPFTAYLMAGWPSETNDDLRDTIQFAKEIKADFYSLSILSPYFGTKLYYDLIERGYPLDKQEWEMFFHQSPEPMVNKNLDPNLLAEYLNLNELNKTGKGYV